MQSPLHLFFTILSSYNRRRELFRLLVWARRKRLARPYRLYHFRLQDEEVRLQRYRLRYPQLVCWVSCFHRVHGWCFPADRYPRHGMAAGYRRNRLNQEEVSLERTRSTTAR